jgi:putative FmdB family regulatory protein
MPIYEYYCADCKRKVNVFFRSFSAAENASAVACPRCGSSNLRRRSSRVRVLKHGSTSASSDFGADDDDLGGDDDDMGDMGDMGGMGGMGQMMAGMDENDPRSIARFARRVQTESGEQMDPEMDEALTRIERGEDPDKVLEGFDEADAPADDDGMI